VCRTAEGGARFEADAVLWTGPLPSLAEGLARWATDAQGLARAGELERLRLILVNLIVARPRVGDASWLYFPESPPRANRAHEPKNFDPAMAPPDRSLLCAEITSRGDDENWRTSDDALLDAVRRELEAPGILRPGDVAGGFVHRVEDAYPLHSLGYRATLDAFLDALAPFANLVPFGRQGLFAHNNLDHSVVMGIRAARAAESDHPAAAMREHDEEFRRFRIID